MVHKFFFNSECLSECNNVHTFAKLFSDTVIEFKSLIDDEKLNIEKGIITEKMPSEISIGKSFSLQKVIDTLENRELRTLAYSYLKNYPIEDHISFEKEDELLEKDYFIKIDGNEHEALYLSFVSKNNGFLFTVALHEDLKQNTLSLVPKTGTENLYVNNLHGERINTDFIKECIEELNHEKLSLKDKLKNLLGNYVFSSGFKREFIKLTTPQQTSIIDCFEKAKKRNLVTPFYPDTKIIKDVTPKNNKCNVYELRVYVPSALRVYFNESSYDHK